MSILKTLMPVAAVCLALVCGCHSTMPAPAPAATGRLQPGENVARLRINGMSCPLCANNITQQLRLIRGVEQVETDLGRGIVLVGVNPERRPTAAQFKGAVAASGFTLVDIQVPWSASTPATQPVEAQPTETQPAPQ